MKVSEALITENSEKPTSSLSLESEITDPTIDKATFTLSSKQERALLFNSEKLPDSESEVAPIDKMPETRKSESEHAHNSEGEEGLESKSDTLQGEEKKKP